MSRSSLLAFLIPILQCANPHPLNAQPAADTAPIGLFPGSRDGQLKAEDNAAAQVSADKTRAFLLVLTEEPHVAGTEADRRTALYVRDLLASWGWKAEIVEHEVLLNYPIPDQTWLEILRPDPAKLSLREEPYAPDKDSTSLDAWPAFHGYSASGVAQGQVVYANYGRPEDFQTLKAHGVDVRGKIVLVRYGELFRGLKVYNAQKQGAGGVLIYSDPAEDGYAKGDLYPNGPYRPPSAIQRGSVQFLSLGPGDPTTPGWASEKGGKRLPIDPSSGFPRIGNPGTDQEMVAAWEKATGQKRLEAFAAIPSLPISYDAARPILERLGGPNAFPGWQGALPFPYHVGPGPVEVRFSVSNDYAIRPIWNVIATITGDVEPDRWVLIGNHRDAWTYGAVDPGSGTAATLEAARVIGEAVKAGWKPKRTLIYASWDAEEYGLVGSTEWAELHAQELDQKAAILLNVDAAVSGHELDVDGIPSLRDLVLQAASRVTHPASGRSLADLWTSSRREAWASRSAVDLDPSAWADSDSADTPRPPEPEVWQPQLGWLGSGSDYTVFVDHLGIPAVDVGFSGRYGVYHSIYDNYFWMERFGDVGFQYHATAARLYARIAMRAAGAEVLPFTYTPYAAALREHVDDLRRLLVRKARQSDRPKIPVNALVPLIAPVRAYGKAASELDDALAKAVQSGSIDPARLAPLNDALQKTERAFLSPSGLPGRPWFRHAVYAPGLTTGYASWPLPGPRQAVTDDNPELLTQQVSVLVDRITAATGALRQVTSSLPSIPPAPAVP